jgi:hypothetical protein
MGTRPFYSLPLALYRLDQRRSLVCAMQRERYARTCEHACARNAHTSDHDAGQVGMARIYRASIFEMQWHAPSDLGLCALYTHPRPRRRTAAREHAPLE